MGIYTCFFPNMCAFPFGCTNVRVYINILTTSVGCEGRKERFLVHDLTYYCHYYYNYFLNLVPDVALDGFRNI